MICSFFICTSYSFYSFLESLLSSKTLLLSQSLEILTRFDSRWQSTSKNYSKFKSDPRTKSVLTVLLLVLNGQVSVTASLFAWNVQEFIDLLVSTLGTSDSHLQHLCVNFSYFSFVRSISMDKWFEDQLKKMDVSFFNLTFFTTFC